MTLTLAHHLATSQLPCPKPSPATPTLPPAGLLGFHEHPHLPPTGSPHSLPGLAHPQKAPPPTSGPADVRSFSSLLCPPSNTAPPVPHPALPPWCLCPLCALLTGWLPGGRGCGHLTVALPLGLEWYLAGASKGTEGRDARGCHQPVPPPFTTSQTRTGPRRSYQTAGTSCFCHVSPWDPHFQMTLSPSSRSERPVGPLPGASCG